MAAVMQEPAAMSAEPVMEEQVEAPEFKVCIEVYADGTIKVGEDMEAPEGMEGEDTGLQAVDNLPAALKIAKGLIDEHMQMSGSPANKVDPFDIGANKVLNPTANKGMPKIAMPSGAEM